jgi:hypothetical protein
MAILSPHISIYIHYNKTAAEKSTAANENYNLPAVSESDSANVVPHNNIMVKYYQSQNFVKQKEQKRK